MPDQIFPSEEHRTTLLGTLKLLGVQHITVEFSGSGDSGSIDQVNLNDANGNNIDVSGHKIDWMTSYQTYKDGKWETKSELSNMPLNLVLESVTYAAIETTGLDWYNNDGGQGTFEIDLTVSPPRIDLDIGINYTETNRYNVNFSGHEENEGDETCTPTTTA